jgi:hypothetical protein
MVKNAHETHDGLIVCLAALEHRVSLLDQCKGTCRAVIALVGNCA